MNFVFYFLFLLTAAAAYYAYNWETQTAYGFQVQESAWPGQLARLTAINQKLKQEGADERNETARLTTDLAMARKEQAEEAAAKAVAAANPAPVEIPKTNALGTITTILGQTYPDCHLLQVEATDIVVGTGGSILQIPYANMPPDLQKRFGYDVHIAPQLSDEQIRAQEKLRQANGP